jgi:hypothetical protein
MKKRMYWYLAMIGMATMMFTGVSKAAASSIFAGIEGAVGSNSGDVEDVLYMGNANDFANHMFVSVAKFPLATISGNVEGIVLSGTITVNIYDTGYGSNDANYFIVQHYTYDNSVDLCLADASLSNAHVETISGVETADIKSYSWDVTSYVLHDIAAGYTYSGFRFVMTDANGKPLTDDNGWQVSCWSSGGSVAPCLSVSAYTSDVITGTLKSSIGMNSGEVLESGSLWLGNPNIANHMMRAIMKYPLSGYTGTIESARLYVGATYLVLAPEESTNYFKLEHYTFDNHYGLDIVDATIKSVEQVGTVQQISKIWVGSDLDENSPVFCWDVTSYLQHDLAAGYTHSAFRLVLTDSAGNYLTDTDGVTKIVLFSDNADMVVSTNSAPTSLSRGHRILLERGLQVQAQIFPTASGSFDLTRWASSNFTTMNFHWTPCLSYTGTAPGSMWGYFDYYYPLITDDISYMSNMVSVQYDDEKDLTNSTVLAKAVSKLAQWREQVPTVISYTNQPGGQMTATQIQSYMQQAKPDMLMFDTYPFNGVNAGGSPTYLYQNMQKYRLQGLAGNDGTGSTPIPYAMYTQTFTDPNVLVIHKASDSEMRLNQFAAWAFGFKFISSFVYESPNVQDINSTLFSGLGDTTPTDAFSQVAETNRQSRNLGSALVRLLSTDVRMIMGKHGTSGATNATPSGVDNDLDNIAGDSYLASAGVTVHPTSGINNNQPGDVIIGFFKPLHEAFDGDDYSNQTYFMVVNGLSDATATSSATQQTIRLTFNFGSSGITSLQRLSRTTGKVETVSLTSNGTGGYYVDITLDGGTGDLFKYKTGAPFVGVVLAGDFNTDYVVNATDIDLLSAAINNHSTNYATYDLTKDGLINSADMDYLIKTILHTYYGDADLNGSVGVSDLSVLAAYYNTPSGASWANGDFDGNGAVGVSDLSILAANYNSGSASTVSWAEAYAQAFGTTSDADETTDASADDSEDTTSSVCSSLGLSLIAGLALMGLMIVKLEE